MTYRMRERRFEKIVWDGENIDEMCRFVAPLDANLAPPPSRSLVIFGGVGLQFNFAIPVGHFVIQDQFGVVDAMTPERFAREFEEAP